MCFSGKLIQKEKNLLGWLASQLPCVLHPTYKKACIRDLVVRLRTGRVRVPMGVAWEWIRGGGSGELKRFALLFFSVRRAQAS